MASAPTPDSDRAAKAVGKLTEQMYRLDEAIDRQAPGSARRLELLREQANLCDARAALRSTRL
jgi:hypothetical protein